MIAKGLKRALSGAVPIAKVILKRTSNMQIKCDPSKLPEPKLPPTKPVKIGSDINSHIPGGVESKHYMGWTEKDERILLKLKSAGLRNVEIAKKMGRSYDSIKTRLKLLKKRGQYEEKD